MARDSTESRFLEVLDRYGGPQHVQLVGELWDRAESRALLEGFLRELFPAELPPGADILKGKADDENVSRCKERPEHRAQEQHSPTAVCTPPPSPPKPDRTLRFGLVFFLCRPQSLRLRRASRQLREILRDVRERMPAGGAVIGVVMKAESGGNGQEMDAGGGGSAVSDLLAMLQAVFPEKSRDRLCSEVRACVLIPGQEENRREIQRLACEALTAADELRKIKPRMKSHCFSWRRRRWKDCTEKEIIQEGTALTVLQYPNGDCVETMTDA